MVITPNERASLLGDWSDESDDELDALLQPGEATKRKRGRPRKLDEFGQPVHAPRRPAPKAEAQPTAAAAPTAEEEPEEARVTRTGRVVRPKRYGAEFV